MSNKFIVLKNETKKEKLFIGLFPSYQAAWEHIEKTAYYHGKFESLHYTFSIMDVQTGKETVPFTKDYERPAGYNHPPKKLPNRLMYDLPDDIKKM